MPVLVSVPWIDEKWANYGKTPGNLKMPDDKHDIAKVAS
jgi:hypothetical protein